VSLVSAARSLPSKSGRMRLKVRFLDLNYPRHYRVVQKSC